MNCKQAQNQFSAALDGELNPGDEAVLQAHLRHCPDCMHLWQQSERIELALRLAEPGDTPVATQTDRIWQHVADSVDRNEAGATMAADRVMTGRPMARRKLIGAGAAAVLVVAAFGLQHDDQSGPPQVVVAAVKDYLTFRAGGMTLNVANAQPGALRQWFNTRVDFELAINMAPPAGYELRGGRLCSFLNRRLVFVHYQNGDAGMSLYLMNGSGLDVPDQSLTRAGARQVSTHVVNGLTTALWQADGLVFVAVSDTTGADLLDFVAAI